MWTELLGYFPETEFFLVFDEVFRPRVTRFRSGNTIFFLAPRYISIGLFQYSLFLIFLCHYRARKYVVILCFFLTHTRSMPYYGKSHKDKSNIFFTASIILLYYSPFLQSIDR